eukprot:12408439-Karenia_brevis.AAC.2
MITKLIDALPDDLKPKVKSKPILKGGRNHMVTVQVEPFYASEVMDYWNDFMEKEENHYNGNKLRTREERSPEMDAKFSVAGRTLNYVQKMSLEIDPTAEVVCTWWPCFNINVTSRGEEFTVAEVDSSNKPTWTNKAKEFLDKSSEDLRRELAAFRRS